MGSDTLLELRMEKASFLTNVLDALSGLFTTAYFNFYSTRFVLEVSDTSGGAYAVLQLSSEAFEHYTCCGEKFSVDLNPAAVAKVFSIANNNDIITMKYQINDGLYFRISLGSPGSHVLKCFHLHTDLDVDDRVSVPKHSESMYQAIVRMPSDKFMHFCNKLNTGDRKNVVTISVDKDNVRFFTDKSSAIVRLRTQNGDKPNEATCIVMKEKISLTFDLRYLKNFSKAFTLSDKVTIKLSSNLHAVFEYEIPNTEIPNTGNIRCLEFLRCHVMPLDKVAETQGIKEEDEMQNC